MTVLRAGVQGRVLLTEFREIARNQGYYLKSDMPKSLRILVIAISLLGFHQVSARVVDTIEDRIRLEGWDEHLKSLNQADRQRLMDKDEVAKERKRWEEEQRKGLAEYREWKKKQDQRGDETGPDHIADLKEREKADKEFERLQALWLAEREKIRRQSRSTVNVTEAEELGLTKDPARVPWEKRDLFSDKKAGAAKPSGSSSAPSNNRGNDFIPPQFDSPPPPPTAPPPEFFEPDIPPPPPPPMPDGGFDMPPGMDEGLPPPIFDDEF